MGKQIPNLKWSNDCIFRTWAISVLWLANDINWTPDRVVERLSDEVSKITCLDDFLEQEGISG